MTYALFPVYWMIVTSFKTDTEIAAMKGFPFIFHREFGSPTLDHYRALFFETDFLLFVKNTVFVAVLNTLFSIGVSILAAYAITRLNFFGSEAMGTFIFCTYLVPATLLFIPMFSILKWIHQGLGIPILDKTYALFIPYPVAVIPFCTWILIGYFSSIPRELDEAAFVDGCNYIQMLWKVFLPVCWPGLIAATMFAFNVSWAGFIYPLAYIYSADQQILTVGVATTLIKGDVMFWGELMAGALLTCLPVVVLYSLLMDYYVSGLTAGSIKG